MSLAKNRSTSDILTSSILISYVALSSVSVPVIDASNPTIRPSGGSSQTWRDTWHAAVAAGLGPPKDRGVPVG